MAGARVWSVVVAAGEGTRFGGAKQYETLGDRRVLDWSLGVAGTETDGVVVVVPVARAGATEPTASAVVTGRPTRSGSVRAGLDAVPHEVEVIVIHDAARPLASSALFRRVVGALTEGVDAAVPVVEVTDTLRWREGGVVDRSQVLAVQTPQAFRAGPLRAAHQGDPEATDDASLIEAAGGVVEVVPGSARNRKITEPEDLAAADAMIEG